MDLTLCLPFHECSSIQRSIFQALVLSLWLFFFHSKYKGAQFIADSINFTNFALTMYEDCNEEYWSRSWQYSLNKCSQ